MSAGEWLTHPLLDAHPHGFGTRGCAPFPGLRRPTQVHGRAVLRVTRESDTALGEADALVCATPGVAIGVVTADCLPVLIATPSGAVAAVHAGWRGLAAGVLQAAVEALAEVARDVDRAVAVIGPRIGAGCYEVDEPVVRALAARFGDAVDGALVPTRPAHFQLDLAALAAIDLANAGVPLRGIAALSNACTACDRERLHSYRRDGANAGRLVHYIEAIEAGFPPRTGS
jgi:YfiH family protein